MKQKPASFHFGARLSRTGLACALLAALLFPLIVLAAGATVKGSLQNAPGDVTFVAYKNQANPAQVLTQANAGGGYTSPNWQVDTTNFSPQHDAGTAMRIVFSDPASPTRFWEKDFDNPTDTVDVGQVAEGSALTGDQCPVPDLTVSGAGSNRLRISWTAQSGVTYNLYHTATGTDPAGNGRYNLLQAVATSPYLHTSADPNQNWYLLVPVDGTSKPLGCISVSQGYQANVITLRRFAAVARGQWSFVVVMGVLALGALLARSRRK